MIQRILYATDLGAYTTQSLIHVEQLAERFDAIVDIVHVVKPIDELAAAVIKSHCSDAVKDEVLAASHITGLLDTVRDEVFDVLAGEDYGGFSLVSRVEHIIVEPGPAAAVILDQADRLASDLIVIGSHGVDAMEGPVLGSVAAKVLNLAKTPVYLVPLLNIVCQVNMSANQSVTR